MLSFSDSYVKLIREGFEQIMSDDSFGPEEYEGLTDIEFPDRKLSKPISETCTTIFSMMRRSSRCRRATNDLREGPNPMLNTRLTAIEHQGGLDISFPVSVSDRQVMR